MDRLLYPDGLGNFKLPRTRADDNSYNAALGRSRLLSFDHHSRIEEILMPFHSFREGK